jgi:hypothetical protein
VTVWSVRPYLATQMRFPAGTFAPANMDLSKFLEGTVTGYAEAISGAVTSTDEIDFAGEPALSAKIDLAGQTLETVTFVHGDDAYMLGVLHEAGAQPDVERFFGSFKLTD